MNKKTKKNQKGLDIRNLTVRVGEKKIIHDVNLFIHPGETHILMGPNGSGKSTLLYALMGHPRYSVEKGNISLNGISLNTLLPEQRAHKGLFLGFQHPREISGLKSAAFLLSLHRTLSKNRNEKKHTDSPLSFMKELKERARALSLNEKDLGRCLNDGFSGGEKKKMEILQMIVSKPTIALLDEIDSGVDVDSLQSILAALRDAQKRFGMGVLLVTHNPRMCSLLDFDRVHMMANGTIVESGDAKLAAKIEKQGYKSINN